MEHVPTTEREIQKVCRIARELGISLQDAAVTSDAFDLAFSDEVMRRAIFEIINRLDDEAARKAEPLGLIINYTVEMGLDGIRVGRYADEIPPGEIVELTPPDGARIFLKINDSFPTQRFLGPLTVNRPGWHFDTFDPDAEVPDDLSQFAATRKPICLGPIRLTFNERFPFISAAKWKSQRSALLLPGLVDAAAASHSGRSSSGLSPPLRAENLGHSDRKMF
jgi:hypothetical protein